MIAIDRLSHVLDGHRILDDLTLTLPRGGLTALIGPNGAGKSTLLRLIGRLDPLQTGRITIDGRDITTTPTAELALKMAILGQQTAIASRLRVRELVSFGRWPHCHGRPGPHDRATVDAALEAFGLTALAGRFLDELSGGQAQRAFIAMTVAQDTDWLLLDEPLNNLDLAHARALMARVAGLVRGGGTGRYAGRDEARAEGRGAVIVLHDVNHAATWADHVVALKDGRLHAEGPAGTVLTADTLSDLYDTPLEVIRHNGRPLILHREAG